MFRARGNRSAGRGHLGSQGSSPALTQTSLKAKELRRHTNKHQLFPLKKALYFPFKQLGHSTLFYINGTNFLNLHLKGLVSESEVIRGYEYKYKNSAKHLARSLQSWRQEPLNVAGPVALNIEH